MSDLLVQASIDEVTTKTATLLNMVHDLKNGEDVDINAVTDLVLSIQRDEIGMVLTLAEIKVKLESQRHIQIPSFVKGARKES